MRLDAPESIMRSNLHLLCLDLADVAPMTAQGDCASRAGHDAQRRCGATEAPNACQGCERGGEGCQNSTHTIEIYQEDPGMVPNPNISNKCGCIVWDGPCYYIMIIIPKIHYKHHKIHNTTAGTVDLTMIDYHTHMTSPHVMDNNPNNSECIYAKPCAYTYPRITRTPYLRRYATDTIPCPTHHIRLSIQYS